MTTTEANTELKTSLEINNTTKENINDSTASTEQSIPNSSFPNSYFHSGMVPLRPGSVTPSDSLMVDSQYFNDRIRSLESEKLTIMIEHNNLIKEFNKRMESHLEEIRALKDSNVQYETELKDLQELSVFLDDDRKKCRRLAKEWQRFGRHTVTVLRGEMAGYQEKNKTLESRQQKLLKENTELRDLCVYLDQQRSGGPDGQANRLNYNICQECSQLKKEHGTLQRMGSKGSFSKLFFYLFLNLKYNIVTVLQFKIQNKNELHFLVFFNVF